MNHHTAPATIENLANSGPPGPLLLFRELDDSSLLAALWQPGFTVCAVANVGESLGVVEADLHDAKVREAVRASEGGKITALYEADAAAISADAVSLSVYSLCMARRNISLPDDLDEQARAARLNVSALAQRAVSDELDLRERMAALDAWLDELDESHGAPSDQANARARAWLDSAIGVKPTRKAATASTATPRAQRAAG